MGELIGRELNDPHKVSGFKRVANLCRNSEYVANRERAAPDAFFERLTLQQFDGDEVETLRFLDLINSADVGMIEG